MLNWSQIDTVLLDMDGTVLDLHFDNVFWSQLLPERYAQRHSISDAEARQTLFGHFESKRHTLDFYCLDHWQALTGIDLCALKEELAHLICYRQGSIKFLQQMRRANKRIVLVTNAHRGSLDVKHRCTALLDHFDADVSAHDLGAPKESQQFWHQLKSVEHYDPARSVFVDDNVTVLDSAREFGIPHLFAIDQPDSHAPKRDALPYPVINRLDQLL